MEYLKIFKSLGSALSNPACETYSNLCFKPQQIQCIEYILKGYDVVAVLPTGYGKSLIFQLLPWVLPPKNGEKNLVLVVCPLSSIIKDQISMLNERGIRAASLPNIFEKKTDDCSSLFPNDETASSSEMHISKEIKEAEIDILFGHPESFLSDSGRLLLKSVPYQRKVVACAVDEAHCVNMW